MQINIQAEDEETVLLYGRQMNTEIIGALYIQVSNSPTVFVRELLSQCSSMSLHSFP